MAEDSSMQEVYDWLVENPDICKLFRDNGHTTVESVIDSLNSVKLSDVLSDMYCKQIVNQDKPFSLDDVAFLMQRANKDAYDSEDDWDDDMVNKYAKHLKNYLYTYKESAKEIDPSINPEELHVGPMAQDIEKVAPDCVKETPEGVKVVDGNRLALVNAGTIGDLTRRLLHLEEQVNG